MITIDTVTILDEELAYDQGGRAVINTGTPPPTGFLNSRLRTEDGVVLDLYNPTLPNFPRTWTISLYITEEKYQQIVDRVYFQNRIAENFRVSLDTNLLRGYEFVYPEANINSRVWWSGVPTITETVIDVASNKIKHRCTVTLNEVEA